MINDFCEEEKADNVQCVCVRESEKTKYTNYLIGITC